MTSDYQRIMVIGSPGAGKSTLATEIAAACELPLVRLDELFWKNNDETITSGQLREVLQTKVLEESWVMDGNYDSSLDIRLERAQLVIWLQISRPKAIWRVVKRYLTYRKKPNPLGNPDRLDWDFISYIWHFPKIQGQRVDQLMAQADPQIKVIKTADTKSVLAQIK